MKRSRALTRLCLCIPISYRCHCNGHYILPELSFLNNVQIEHSLHQEVPNTSIFATNRHVTYATVGNLIAMIGLLFLHLYIIPLLILPIHRNPTLNNCWKKAYLLLQLTCNVDPITTSADVATTIAAVVIVAILPIF